VPTLDYTIAYKNHYAFNLKISCAPFSSLTIKRPFYC